MKNLRLFALFVVLVSFLLSGCYWNADVNPNQMGVQIESNEIFKVVGPGLYSGGWFGELVVINMDTLTFSVEDPEVLTSDRQAIGLKVTIQARRNRDEASIRTLITNWASLVNDEALIGVITATSRESMKNGVIGFTLNSLLDDRNGLANAIKDSLTKDAEKYGVEIVNVTIENVSASPEYMKALSDKSLIQVNTDVELQRQKLIEQKAANDILQAEKSKTVLDAQLNVQKAQTAIDVEIAEREGKKIAAAQAVYAMNPQAFELKKWEFIQNTFGAGTVYFVQPGQDLSTFFNAQGQIVPVTQP